MRAGGVLSAVPALLLSACVSLADQVVLVPTDDADVWQFQPDSCLGSAQSFQVGFFAQYRRNSLIKFDLTPYFGETVNSAVLRLYVLSAYGEFPADGICISRNDANWDELSVTWNNRPGETDSRPIDSPLELEQWWEIDVTEWVQDIVSGASPDLGFQICQNDDDYSGFAMTTSEGVYIPELVLDLSPSVLLSSTFGGIKVLLYNSPQD